MSTMTFQRTFDHVCLVPNFVHYGASLLVS